MQGLAREEIRGEVASLLSDLIKIDTTNPPGNESMATRFLASNLAKEGFKCEIIESTPNRGNLMTRLKGTDEKPRLLLLSHLDVVPANPAEWSVHPFSGEIKDGYVWGRGALDMKGMTAIEVTALKLLKRNDVKIKGEVLLAAMADEEKGGVAGAEFLTCTCPEKVFAEYVINEGGGSSLSLHHKNVYTVNSAEKGLIWFKIKAKGTSGHGSLPQSADNAILRMNKVISKLATFHVNVELVPTVKQFLSDLSSHDRSLKEPLGKILVNPQQSDSVLIELEKNAPAIANEIQSKLKMTITPTIIHGGIKENVIPSECEAVFDCRILPGQNVAGALEQIKCSLMEVGLDKLSFEIIQAQEPTESPIETPLYRQISEVLADFEPGCCVSPTLFAGGTDSRFFRHLGAVCYGFHPLRSETRFDEKPTRLEHAVNEKISIDNLVFGTSVLYETIKRFMT
jgi:acetylornithine deacetylase/succinyl-diaminopimelate desuccinylase-like protein